jgi:hypothetical protein
MSSYCHSIAQNCAYGCCDFNGFCPSFQSQCYYYYNQHVSSFPGGAIAGVVIGFVILISCIVLTAWYCKRRRARQTQYNNQQQQPGIIPGQS